MKGAALGAALLAVGTDAAALGSLRAGLVPGVAPEWLAVDSVEAALEHLAARPVVAVVIDLVHLPAGVGVADRVVAGHPTVPVVVVVPDGDQEPGLAAVRAGAQAYVVAGELGTPMLPRVVHAAVGRAQARAEVDRREAQHRAVLDSLGEGVVLQDDEGMILAANPAAHRILGVGPNRLVGRRPHHPGVHFVDEHGRPLDDDELPSVHALRTGRPVRGVPVGIDGADGQRRWVEANAYPLTDPVDPRRRQTVTSFVDVTARRAADEQVRLQARVLDLVGQAVVVTDAEDLVRYWNLAAEDLFGWPAGEAMGQSVVALLFSAGDDAGVVLEEKRRAYEQGRTWQRDLRVRRRDGTPRTVFGTFTPVLDDQGAVTACIGVMADITERKHAEDLLAHSATHDPLTGLPNRVLLEDRVAQALTRADEHRRWVAVFFLDLDGFKEVNDRHGHLVGDHLLVQVGVRLAGALRPDDTVGRFGGDEFVVVCEVSRVAEATAIGQRLLAAFDAPLHVDGQDFAMAASVGLVVGDGDSTPTGLLRDADTAMYEAKRRGRARLVTFGHHDAEPD